MDTATSTASAPITIVIPVHNRASLVGETLASVEAQTFRPLRLIVVDNGSTDGTPALLARWKEEHRTADFTVDILSEPRPGAAAARNRGLAEVTSPYTMFFDSDDIMAPGHVARAMEGFASPAAPDIVGWDCREIDLQGDVRIVPFVTRSPLRHTIFHGTMSTQRYAARTSLFRQAGGWNPDIYSWNDIELAVRLLRLSPSIIRLKGEPTVTIRRTAVSITGTSYSSGAGRREASLDSIEANLATDRQHRLVRLRRAHLAGLYAAEGRPDLSAPLLSRALAAEPSPLHRLLLRATCAITGRRIRGALRLFSPFF